jgi:hypothetical protein
MTWDLITLGCFLDQRIWREIEDVPGSSLVRNTVERHVLGENKPIKKHFLLVG